MREWRESANRRRDERHTLAPETLKPANSKRNTRRWCKGKVGAEHKPVAKDYAEVKARSWIGADFPWQIVVCENCGKHIKYQRKPRS